MLTRRVFRTAVSLTNSSFKRPGKIRHHQTTSSPKTGIVCKVFFVPTSLAFLTVAKAAPKGTKESMADESLQNILQNADQLFDENHFQDAYDVLDKFHDQSLPEVKWRKARALYSFSKTIKDKEERNKIIRDSYALIIAALEADENNFAIHKWMSIILDAYAELDGIKSRICQLELVKKHMLRAVELNPSDPTSWYLLGQFEYSLADMPWIQRKIVATIFASPPTGSYDKALEYFEKAEGLKAGFYTTNWLMLGKCYMVQKNMDNAKMFLEKAANCRTLNEDDKTCKEEATKLLKKL